MTCDRYSRYFRRICDMTQKSICKLLKVASRTNNLSWNQHKSTKFKSHLLLLVSSALRICWKTSKSFQGCSLATLPQPVGPLCNAMHLFSRSCNLTKNRNVKSTWLLPDSYFNQDTQAACTKVVHEHSGICLVSQTKHHKTFLKQLRTASCTNEEAQHCVIFAP